MFKLRYSLRAAFLAIPFALATILLGSGNAQSSSIKIDDFEVEQDVGFIGIPNFIPSSSQVGPDSSILGEFRDMQVRGNANNFLETRLQVVNGQISFSNNVGTIGSGIIVWDGDDDPTVVDTQGLGGIDITNNNGWDLDGIFLDIISADLPGLELTFAIYDTNSNISRLSRSFNESITTPQTKSFLFNDFIGNADLTNVGAIELDINGPAEIDATIDIIQIDKSQNPSEISSISEPTTPLWVFVGISILGSLSTKSKNFNKE